MQRDLYQKLLEWKEKPDRKPLVVKGARQVGKTYLIKDFGNHEFDNIVVLNADKDLRVREIFERGFRIDRIISDMEVLSRQTIVPGRTLIFIDEVGDAPKALAALKYFCEDAPQYHIVVAGSLLGLAIHKGVSFPVGKVDELTLYPLSFAEFVRARLGERSYVRLIMDPLADLATVKTIRLYVTFKNKFFQTMRWIFRNMQILRSWEEFIRYGIPFRSSLQRATKSSSTLIYRKGLAQRISNSRSNGW